MIEFKKNQPRHAFVNGGVYNTHVFMHRKIDRRYVFNYKDAHLLQPHHPIFIHIAPTTISNIIEILSQNIVHFSHLSIHPSSYVYR